jgi:hypothetical protein
VAHQRAVTNAKVAGFDTAVAAAALRRLADAWMRQPSPDSDLLSGEAVERLAGAERALRSAGLWMAGPASLIEVLGLVRDEVRNCRVLRWLPTRLLRTASGSRRCAVSSPR